MSKTAKLPIHIAADSDPPAIRSQRGAAQRFIADANAPRQGSYGLRGRVEAKDGSQIADATVAPDGQRQTIGRQGETFDAVELLVKRCDHLAARGAQPPDLVVDDDQPSPSREKIRRRKAVLAESIANVSLPVEVSNT